MTTVSNSEVLEEDLKDPRVPVCLYWDSQKVADWIEDIGYLQYRSCFLENNINGKKLILMDASNLPRIGITDFIHLKSLAKSIRDLLGTEDPDYFRRIKLPPRDDLGMYLEFISQSGASRNGMTYQKFLDTDMVDGKWQPPLCNGGLLFPRPWPNDVVVPKYFN